jgi:cobalt-precorrin-5B (C1)-methyltransferase
MARTGYTLPVFAVAAAKAALIHLQEKTTPQFVELDLLPDTATILIQQVAILEPASALAITISDPGDNLDLTRNMPIWARVTISNRADRALVLEAGEGLGKTITGEVAIYRYARRLFESNLSPLIPVDQTITVQIILPEGRQLAQRTSNEAFGILEGLALLGTSGIAQPLSVSEHLEEFRRTLQDKATARADLVFCIGNNGQQVAQRLSIPEEAIVPTGNWLGAMLVEAGLHGVRSVLLLGYQGKLIKLAGGIFNTSSHIADAKLEIMAAAVARAGGDLSAIEAVLQSKTADEAHKVLVQRGLSDAVFRILTDTIQRKAEQYVQKYANAALKINVILFDRHGQIIQQDTHANTLKDVIRDQDESTQM